MSIRSRIQSRVAFAFARVATKLSGRSIFAGAAWNRLMTDWIFGPVSSQRELFDLRVLRDRGRELERDNAYAGRYVELASENIVADTGLRLQAMNYRGEELDDAVNDEIERAWAEFSRARIGDARGQLSMLDLQRVVVERWKGGDGEALVQLIVDGPHGIQYLLLDPDQLDETLWRARANIDRDGADVNAIISGVEIDRRGRAVAYHLWSDHPMDMHSGKRERVRIPAEFIIHLFTPARPGQVRGLTRFARVMKTLRHLGGYTEAVIVNMRASACKMGFLQPREGAEPLTNAKGEEKVEMEASPGVIGVIPFGYEFSDWNPTQPTAAHKEVVQEFLYELAAGLGIAHSSLTGNLTGANYGSQRGGLLSERRGWRRDQQYLAEHLMQRLFAEWLRMASITGAVRLPRADYTRYLEHTWLLPGWPWIDPAKDIDAGLAEVRAGLDSLTSLAAAKGRDFETVLGQRAREMKLAKKYGVHISLDDAFDDNSGEMKNADQGTEAAGEDAAGTGAGDRARARLVLARRL